MRAYLVMLMVPVVATATVALGSVDIANFYGSIAKGFFFVVPIGFTIGSAIGLASRLRA